MILGIWVNLGRQRYQGTCVSGMQQLLGGIVEVNTTSWLDTTVMILKKRQGRSKKLIYSQIYLGLVPLLKKRYSVSVLFSMNYTRQFLLLPETPNFCAQENTKYTIKFIDLIKLIWQPQDQNGNSSQLLLNQA